MKTVLIPLALAALVGCGRLDSKTKLPKTVADNAPQAVKAAILEAEGAAEATRTVAAAEQFRQLTVAEGEADAIRSVYKAIHDGKSTPELRRQIESLLKRLDQSPAGNRLRELRAVEVLEHLGTIASQRLLRTLASGAMAARLTQEASASLNRLNKRSK